METLTQEQEPQYRTMQEIAVSTIRKTILDGTYKPGQRLPQDELASTFGFSRMPIREALRRLESEGLVTFHPHRGAVVREISVDELEEVYLMRCLLEGTAARFGAVRIGEEQLARMEGLIQEMPLGEVEPTVLISIENQFHDIVVDAAGLPKLASTIREMRASIQRILLSNALVVQRGKLAVDEDSEILAACRRHDGIAAERWTKQHLQQTAIEMISHLRSLGRTDREGRGILLAITE